MGNMQYAEMKDSGVEWIGEIPKHWSPLKLKYASWLKGRIGWQGLKSDEYIDEGAYLITGTDFDNGSINWNTCAHISVERFNEDSDIHIQENDLLITKDGTIGKVAVAKRSPGMVSLNSGVMLIRNVRRYKYYDKYLYYILMSEQFHLWYELSQNGASTIKHLYQEQFYNFTFSYPPIKEQTAIASYLDDKCTAIDDVIAQAKETIEEYKSWKASVIFEAVTKGLDPNVEMKDSGVEWIGKIPKHWRIVKVKYCTTKIGSGKTPRGGAEIYTDSGITFLRSQNIYDEGLKLAAVSFIPEEIDNEMISTRVFPDDVLLNITGGSIGRCCLYPQNMPCANVNQHVCIIRVKPNIILPQLMHYLWCSHVGQTAINIYQSGANREGMNFEQIGNVAIPIMGLQEQRHLKDYLDDKCATIDSIISEKQVLIDELESYKKSLIFETVTGKRRVC